MYKLYLVSVDFEEDIEGIEFYIVTYSIVHAWKEVSAMGLAASTISIREKDTADIQYFLDM